VGVYRYAHLHGIALEKRSSGSRVRATPVPIPGVIYIAQGDKGHWRPDVFAL
jgi:hypothetical protein